MIWAAEQQHFVEFVRAALFADVVLWVLLALMTTTAFPIDCVSDNARSPLKSIIRY